LTRVNNFYTLKKNKKLPSPYMDCTVMQRLSWILLSRARKTWSKYSKFISF